MAGPWTCPRCQSPQVVTWAARGLESIEFEVVPLGKYGLEAEVISCADAECGGYELRVQHGPWTGSYLAGNRLNLTDEAIVTRLVPTSRARTYPEYVPVAVRQDYEEACAIEQASPKAAATLARRALQGMIRDYWEVGGERTLWREVEALKDKPEVSSETWEAIDAVRKVGNIGAHMERDIDVIIDVDPSEAAALIQLIEMLIEDWYVARHQRRERLAHVKQIGDSKDADKSAAADAAHSPNTAQ